VPTRSQPKRTGRRERARVLLFANAPPARPHAAAAAAAAARSTVDTTIHRAAHLALLLHVLATPRPDRNCRKTTRSPRTQAAATARPTHGTPASPHAPHGTPASSSYAPPPVRSLANAVPPCLPHRRPICSSCACAAAVCVRRPPCQIRPHYTSQLESESHHPRRPPTATVLYLSTTTTDSRHFPGPSVPRHLLHAQNYRSFSFLFLGGLRVDAPSVPSPSCAIVPRATLDRSTRPPFEPVEQTRPGKSHPHPVTSATSANQLPAHWYSTSVCTRLWPLSPMFTLPQLSTRSAWILHEPAVSGCPLCADLLSMCSGRLQCAVYLRVCASPRAPLLSRQIAPPFLWKPSPPTTTWRRPPETHRTSTNNRYPV
jgi:hypothetical protein